MADMNERDTKLVQYLMEAYGKEQELEMSLKADIDMTTKMPYKKRLRAHLTETKNHSRQLDRRIKQLGGGGHKMQTIVGKTMAAAKGPLHAVRGTGEQERMLKNAKTEYFNEAEEIATYLGIEALAEKVGDKETAKLARGIRREEERMAKFLEGQIKTLANAVALEEVPAQQRRPATRSRSRTSAQSRNGASRNGAPRARRPVARTTKTRTTNKSRSRAKAAA